MAADSGVSDLGGRLRAIALSFGVAVSGFVAGVVVLFVLVGLLLSAGVEVTPVEELFLSLVALQGIGFPLVAFAYLRLRDLPSSFIPVSVPSLRGVALILGGWIGVLVLAYVGALLVTVFVSSPAENQAAGVAFENPEIIPYLLPLVILLNGPGEELLFRGVVQGTLRERFGPAAAIVLASLMFSPAHLTALLGAPLESVLATMAILLVPSFGFGALYEYSENIVVPSLVHGLYNATLFGALYLVATSDIPMEETLVGLAGLVP